MVVGVNLSDALAALRSLDLPEPRRRELVARALQLGGDETELRRFVYRARAEEARVADENRVHIAQEFAQRLQRAVEHREPLPEPSSPAERRSGRFVPDVQMPMERPVTVRYVEPTKPPAPRKQSRAEGITGGKRVRQPAAIVHGTVHAYVHRECRCQPCDDAYRANNRLKSQRRKERQQQARQSPGN